MKKKQIDPSVKKILDGINRANNKMIREAALKNEYLVFGDGKGGVIIKKAKEVIKETEKEKKV